LRLGGADRGIDDDSYLESFKDGLGDIIVSIYTFETLVRDRGGHSDRSEAKKPLEGAVIHETAKKRLASCIAYAVFQPGWFFNMLTGFGRADSVNPGSPQVSLLYKTRRQGTRGRTRHTLELNELGCLYSSTVTWVRFLVLHAPPTI
jgi:hypothetical protein